MSKYSVEDLKRMYEWKIIDEAFLDQAVLAGWITQKENDSIVQEG